jgi:hypothetical protein
MCAVCQRVNRSRSHLQVPFFRLFCDSHASRLRPVFTEYFASPKACREKAGSQPPITGCVIVCHAL